MGGIYKGTNDGIFGQETRKAVKLFQQKYCKQPFDGLVRKQTRLVIEEQYEQQTLESEEFDSLSDKDIGE